MKFAVIMKCSLSETNDLELCQNEPNAQQRDFHQVGASTSNTLKSSWQQLNGH